MLGFMRAIWARLRTMEAEDWAYLGVNAVARSSENGGL